MSPTFEMNDRICPGRDSAADRLVLIAAADAGRMSSVTATADVPAAADAGRVSPVSATTDVLAGASVRVSGATRDD